MKNPRNLFSIRLIIIAILVLLGAAVAMAFGFKGFKNESKPSLVREIKPQEENSEIDDDLSKVVLSVKNMSCSGCISTIKGSLSGISGIKDILVDIGTGKTEVYFDNKKLEDVSLIEKAITASGYPAEVLKTVSAQEIKKERDLAAARSQFYIASVGGWDIARPDFNTEMEIAKKGYSKIYGDKLFDSAQGKLLLDNLKVQIVSRLINEGTIMQEVTKSGFKVDAEIIERELQGYLQEQGKDLTSVRRSLEEAGYKFDYFKKKFETKVLISKYINERILADASNDFEKQNLFNAWFNNSKVLAEVVYYDKDLESLIQAKSSSGGCGAGS
ncbi:MAG: SurA N-terminal domain-containing protein [Pseudomonadota bacterium]